MLKSVEHSKNAIREFIKKSSVLVTPLGDFPIRGSIGEGGNALVYELDAGKGRQLAVKFLAEDCSSEKSKRYQRFLTEYREIVQLQDTGLVASAFAISYLETNDGKFPYILMKRYAYTLEQWIKRKPVLKLQDLLPLVGQLIDCLKLIHSHNIVHRDLKPKNIFVTNDGKLILADFGIAWFDPEHYERLARTSPNERLANWGFSAPEQFQSNHKPYPTMDLFALGQIIQWIVTQDTHKGTGRRRLTEIDPSFAPIDPLVESLLQHDPLKRPQSVVQLAEMLDLALAPTETSKHRNILYGLDEFEGFLARMFPGKHGIISVTLRDKIDRFMSELSHQVETYEIWMERGLENKEIRHIRKWSEDIWLLDFLECKIDAIWVNKSDASTTTLV